MEGRNDYQNSRDNFIDINQNPNNYQVNQNYIPNQQYNPNVIPNNQIVQQQPAYNYNYPIMNQNMQPNYFVPVNHIQYLPDEQARIIIQQQNEEMERQRSRRNKIILMIVIVWIILVALYVILELSLTSRYYY